MRPSRGRDVSGSNLAHDERMRRNVQPTRNAPHGSIAVDALANSVCFAHEVRLFEFFPKSIPPPGCRAWRGLVDERHLIDFFQSRHAFADLFQPRIAQEGHAFFDRRRA